jgi:hypothetical protein
LFSSPAKIGIIIETSKENAQKNSEAGERGFGEMYLFRRIRLKNMPPPWARKFFLVGSESVGNTRIANLTSPPPVFF